MSSGSKAQTIGYKYYLGFHLGWCHGPVDALLEIRAGDRTVWQGTQTASGAISLNKPELFGGDEREGGIVGTADVMMGESTQAPNSYLVSKIGAGRPAYRGILGLVFRGGHITSNNPYIKPWAAKVRRILQGWKGGTAWYPEKAPVPLPGGAPQWGSTYEATTTFAAPVDASASSIYSVAANTVGFARGVWPAPSSRVSGSYSASLSELDGMTINYPTGYYPRGHGSGGWSIGEGGGAPNTGLGLALVQNEATQAGLFPASHPTTANWYDHDEGAGPTLVWFSSSHVYVGTRLLSAGLSAAHNKIYRWPLSASGTNVSSDAVANDIAGPGQIFWMTMDRAGRIHTLATDGTIKTFDADLNLLSTTSQPSLPSIGTAGGPFGIDGDLLVRLDSVTLYFSSLSSGALLGQVLIPDTAGPSGNTVSRIVFTADSIYAQGGVGVTRIAYTPGSGPGMVAMNPAHIIYECLTNDEWGMGYDSSIIDAASFAAAADTFYAEGLGLCLQWSRQDTIEAFIQLVCNHAGAVCVQDPRSELIKLTAIRDDYDIESLPVFSDTAGNVISMERMERATVTDTVNEITVSYVDSATGKPGSVTVQNLAAIQAAGRVISQSVDYPGLPTIELALRAAMRDLRSRTAGMARLRLTVTRAGYDLLPGSVIPFSWSPDGIVRMALRVVDIDYGSLVEGRIGLECAEDVFGLPDTTYAQPEPGGWVAPDTAPQASPAVAVFEAPYRELLQTLGRGDTQALTDEAGYLAAVAARPPGFSLNYQLYTRTGADPYADTGAADWCPTGTLQAGIGPTATVIVLDDADGLDEIEIGETAMLGSGASAEIVRVDAVAGSTVTIARGCLDTVPQAWPLGTRFWGYDQASAGSVTEYADAETVDAKILTRTTSGLLAEGSAPGASLTLNQRQARPYPPGLFRINTEAYPTYLFGELTITWAHRDRLLQDDQVIDTDDASIGPEAGTTYTVRVYLDEVLVNTQAAIATTTATYLPLANGTVRVELESVRDGLTSWQMHSHEFDFTTAEVSLLGAENGDELTTEAGDLITTE